LYSLEDTHITEYTVNRCWNGSILLVRIVKEGFGMQISVFTSEGCVNCEEIKELLDKKDLGYTEFDANEALNPSTPDFFKKYPDWRTSGIFEALGLATYDDTLPITVIDGKAHTFKEAKNLLSNYKTNDPENKTVFVDFTNREVMEEACVAAL
jgi:hypothetical protein